MTVIPADAERLIVRDETGRVSVIHRDATIAAGMTIVGYIERRRVFRVTP